MLNRKQPLAWSQRTTHGFANRLLHYGIRAIHTATVFCDYVSVNEVKMVGAVRFELTTSCTRNKRATRLRYAPNHQMSV